MACPAGFAFFHGFHADFGLALTGGIQLGMAFVAAVEPGVRGVLELHITGALDDVFLICCRMAAAAFFIFSVGLS